MIKFCKEQWDDNKDDLENVLRNSANELYRSGYKDIVKLIVSIIFNRNGKSIKYNCDAITVINDGDYQGTLLFMISEETYQPSSYEYLLTYVYYGSCSGCDTLEKLREDIKENEPLSDEVLKGFMSLCKDIVTNTIKPYNDFGRNTELYETVDI